VKNPGAKALHAILLTLMFTVAGVRPAEAEFPINTTTTSLTVSSSSVTAGTAVTLTATLMGNQAPVTVGQVKFCDATAAQCDGAGLFGVAQVTTNQTATLKLVLGVGSYSIQAFYEGSFPIGLLNLPSNSPAQSVTVTGAANYATSTAIAAGGNAAGYTLTGTVTGFGKVATTGKVSFLDTSNSNAAVSSASLNPGTLGWTTVPSSSSPLSGQPNLSFVATGDFNNDGIPDIAICYQVSSGTIAVYLGRGDGSFQSGVSYDAGSYPATMVVADVNGDGNQDVITSNIMANNVNILLGNGDGTFQTATTASTGNAPIFTAVGDFNGDGWIDLAVANVFDNTVSILLGNGDGTFQTQATYGTGSGPNGVVAGDFNQDGNLDLATSNGNDGTVSILLGNGDGTFQTATSVPLVSGTNAGWLATGDLRNNGTLDLVVPSTALDSFYVLLGNGNGTFQAATAYDSDQVQQGVSLGDWNGDGVLDVILPVSGDNVVSVYLGNGDGTFQNNTDYTVGENPAWVALADFNGDGLLDLASADDGSLTSTILLQARTETATASGIAIYGADAHPVRASYPGDGDHSASQSATIPLMGLAQIVTSTALTISPNPANPGQSIGFTATISPAPTGQSMGTVGFYSGSTLLGTGAVNSSGAATLTTTVATAGSYTITAVYSGNPEFAASTSSGVSVTIGSNSTYSVSAPSTPVTVAAGGTAVFHIEVPPVGGAFDNQVTMSASGLPAGAVASFSPPVVVPGSAGAQTTLTIEMATQAAALPDDRPQAFPSLPSVFSPSNFSAINFSPIPLAAGLFLVVAKRKALAKSLLFLAALAMLAGGTLALSGCNGGLQSAARTPYVITVTGSSGAQHASTTVTLIVQ
jgi:hypothetical protein